MRISKERAREAAAKLTATAKEKADALYNEYVGEVVKFYNALLPKEVIDFAKKYPQHVCFADHINFEGHGFSRSYVSLPGGQEVVSNVAGYAQAHLPLTTKSADIIRKAENKWRDADKGYKALRDQTKQALLNLGTTKRIAEELPVAIPYIGGDVPRYPVPALNLAPLKAKLARLQAKKEKTA